MSEHINLKAYDNYEVFTDGSDIESYRKSKLDEIRTQANFIEDEVGKDDISMVELGSGNCKLPILLEKRKKLKKAYGYEISDSRHSFAEEWIKSGNIENVFPVKSDFMKLDKSSHSDLDLVVCVDVAFQFIDPIYPGEDLGLLQKIYRWLGDDGKFVLEINDYSNYKNIKTWEEFEEPDPWRFSLWDCKYDEINRWLTFDKTFVKRDTGEAEKNSVVLRVYELSEIVNILMVAGFTAIKVYSDWSWKPYEPGDFQCIIVAGK